MPLRYRFFQILWLTLGISCFLALAERIYQGAFFDASFIFFLFLWCGWQLHRINQLSRM